MVRRTSGYTIELCRLFLLAATLLLAIGTPASAQGFGSQLRNMGSSGQNSGTQQAQPRPHTEPEIEYPLFNGLDIGVDILGPALKAFGSDSFSAEASAAIDLKHRFFPTVELGYDKSDVTNDNDTHYRSKSPYGRIGIDYNVLYKKAHGNMLLVGLRYGMSSTTYDVDSPSSTDAGYSTMVGQTNLTDPIWKDTGEYSHHGMKSNMHWVEVCAGVKVNVTGQIYMAWNIRLKYKLSASADKYGDPYYVAGFGRYKSSQFGLTYSIVYKLPVKF